MNKKSLVIFLFQSAFTWAASAHSLTAVCNVSEIPPTSASNTTAYTFDGSLQTPSVTLSLFKDMDVSLQGSPGAVGNTQAYSLIARISDADSGARVASQSFFVAKRKYSESFSSIIPGSLMLRLTRKNGDRVEVDCFNPAK